MRHGVLFAILLVGCSSNEAGTDGGMDATTDAPALDATSDVHPIDASSDATTIDATADASADASTDATQDATTDGATDAGADADASDAQSPYAHTITIDGTNDFASEDVFATTSNGYTAYVSWDATYVYVGMNGADVSSNDPKRWLLVYFGGAGGTTTGVTYNTQTPPLPFSALHHVRWKADNSYTDAQSYNGSSWVEANWDFTGGVYQSGNYIEMRVARSDLGSPTTSLPVAVAMLNETNNVEATYAGVPSTTFTDGYDPTWSKYFDFDLTSSTVPNAYATKP